MGELSDGIHTEQTVCHCLSTHHTVQWTFFDGLGKEPDELHFSVFLNERPFWTRLWYGIKYIFGYKCPYGHFDSFILHPAEAKKLQEVLGKVAK